MISPIKLMSRSQLIYQQNENDIISFVNQNLSWMVKIWMMLIIVLVLKKILIITMNLIQKMMIMVLVLIEQFTASDFDDFDIESDDEYPDSNLESDDSWILLWILKYQARFRLPDVAIDSLIKFFQIVLSDANHERFKNFPTSSYMMRKLLEIGKQSKTYAICPSCNKLYNISEIHSTTG